MKQQVTVKVTPREEDIFRVGNEVKHKVSGKIYRVSGLNSEKLLLDIETSKLYYFDSENPNDYTLHKPAPQYKEAWGGDAKEDFYYKNGKEIVRVYRNDGQGVWFVITTGGHGFCSVSDFKKNYSPFYGKIETVVTPKND